MKEMLFSSSKYAAIIGRNAKRMMTQLSIPADDALQSTLSFFEKVSSTVPTIVYHSVSLHWVSEETIFFLNSVIADGG